MSILPPIGWAPYGNALSGARVRSILVQLKEYAMHHFYRYRFRLVIILLLAAFITPPVFAGPAHSNADAGKKIFGSNCLGCHQAAANGGAGIAPVLTNPELLRIASDRFLFTTIKHGRSAVGMPAWAWLGDDKIRQVIHYLRTQSTLPSLAAKLNAQSAAKGDAKRGAMLFSSICATCHGVGGRGYEEGHTGAAIGDSDFLRVASDGFMRYVIKHGRSGTAMRGFSGAEAMAALSDREIDDVIVYLRTIPITPQGDAS
ncbi:MAG: c-type cytochrome [Mariprofundales bacterium]|nr:c-type cytochrome [Mariprofundales bacterium]